ncbi:hypothetical protein V2J09_016865 [Rumex salicifolius]
MVVESYLFNHFNQDKWRVRCGGVCISVVLHLPFLYGLLCYGRKASSNLSRIRCGSVLRKLGWLLRQLNFWRDFGSMDRSLVFSEFPCGGCVLPPGAWLIFRPLWPNMKLSSKISKSASTNIEENKSKSVDNFPATVSKSVKEQTYNALIAQVKKMDPEPKPETMHTVKKTMKRGSLGWISLLMKFLSSNLVPFSTKSCY